MVFSIEDVHRLRSLANKRSGVLEFRCNGLFIFDGLDFQLEQRLRPIFVQRAINADAIKPGMLSGALKAIGGDFGASVGKAHKDHQTAAYWERLKLLGFQSSFRRAVADLQDKELALLSASSAHVLALYEQEHLREELLYFLFGINARVVWGGGRTQYMRGGPASRFPSEAAAAEDLMRMLMACFINGDEAAYWQDVGDFLGQFTQAAQSGLRQNTFRK